VLVAECSLDPIVAQLQDTWRLADSADIHLVQRLPDGSAQWITPPRFNADLTFTATIPAAATASPAQRSLEPSPSVVTGTDYRDVEVIAAVTRVDAPGWGLVVKMDAEEAYSPITQLRRTLVAAFLGTIAAVALVSSLLSRSIIVRLRRVTDAATAISQGDLNRRVDDSSKDEVGRLAGAFDRMTTQLARDVSRRCQVEQLLEHQATHDVLTGLPNRLLAHERLSEALARAEPGTRWVALLFCDLDQFKAINDGLGHSVGDELLAEVAVRLRAAMRAGDTLARFGGDEFVVVCPDLPDPAGASLVAARFRETLAAPFPVGEGKDVVVTVSIGSVITDDPSASPEMLIRDADAAMYRAKELGRDRHVALDDEIRTRATTGLSVLTDLRRAIDSGALTLDYQPVVDLATGAVLGFEALVRWPHPERGLLYPPQFLELADRHGLTPALDRWVLGAAANQMMAWRRANSAAERLGIWVNLSAVSLDAVEVVESVGDALAVSGIDPASVTIEVIEGAFAGDNQRPADHLRAIRELGVRVAVDDFGSGYSSLDRLRTLPFDVLKVDRSFVADIDDKPEAQAIIAAVAALARAFGVGLVGEGVERETQRIALRELGATAAQGYLIARPAPPAQAIAILDRTASLASAAGS
jgi:diguanylate cyclase (GGDEF)-like protein